MTNKQNLIIYKTIDNKVSVALYVKDGTVWLSQNQLAELFATSKSSISENIKNILQNNELDENSVVRYFRTTAADNKTYEVKHYNLSMILAIGFRVRSLLGVAFRQWASNHLQEYLIKGFVMDDDRLKNPDGRPDYFDELLARIGDIRASEKRFYQKIRDLFALCIDYDSDDKATQMFFAQVQNKLLFAVTQKTAAEIIINRADAGKKNMGLTNWQGNIVRKQDIYIAKNYLNVDEIDSLNRLVVIFLETAELQAKNQLNITMEFWKNNADEIITLNKLQLLKNAGAITHLQMKDTTLKTYEAYNAKRGKFDAKIADLQDEKDLRQLTEKITQARD